MFVLQKLSHPTDHLNKKYSFTNLFSSKVGETDVFIKQWEIFINISIKCLATVNGQGQGLLYFNLLFLHSVFYLFFIIYFLFQHSDYLFLLSIALFILCRQRSFCFEWLSDIYILSLFFVNAAIFPIFSLQKNRKELPSVENLIREW